MQEGMGQIIEEVGAIEDEAIDEVADMLAVIVVSETIEVVVLAVVVGVVGQVPQIGQPLLPLTNPGWTETPGQGMHTGMGQFGVVGVVGVVRVAGIVGMLALLKATQLHTGQPLTISQVSPTGHNMRHGTVWQIGGSVGLVTVSGTVVAVDVVVGLVGMEGQEPQIGQPLLPITNGG